MYMQRNFYVSWLLKHFLKRDHATCAQQSVETQAHLQTLAVWPIARNVTSEPVVTCLICMLHEVDILKYIYIYIIICLRLNQSLVLWWQAMEKKRPSMPGIRPPPVTWDAYFMLFECFMGCFLYAPWHLSGKLWKAWQGGVPVAGWSAWSWKNGPMPTLTETNSSPLKIGHPKRKVVFQPSIFRGYVSFREGTVTDGLLISFNDLQPCSCDFFSTKGRFQNVDVWWRWSSEDGEHFGKGILSPPKPNCQSVWFNQTFLRTLFIFEFLFSGDLMVWIIERMRSSPNLTKIMIVVEVENPSQNS